MTEEVESTVTEEVQSQDQDAEFAAAFHSERTGEEPQAPEAQPEPAAEVVAEAEPEQAEPTIDDRMNQLRQEVYAEVGKVRDTLQGRFGEFKDRLHQVMAQQQSSGGSTVKLTKESMKRLAAEFPAMAEMLAEDLSEVLKAPEPIDTTSMRTQLREEVRNEVREEVRRDVEAFKLSVLHSDWKTVTADNGFRSWLASRPLEYQDRINSSWDAQEIAAAISEFKAGSQKAVQQAQQKKERLAAAVTPTQANQAAPAPDTLDDFLAGFNSARG